MDLATGQPANAQSERSDVTAVPGDGRDRRGDAAIVLADAMLEKFGGDSLAEMRRNYDGYLAALGAAGRRCGKRREDSSASVVLVGLPGVGKSTVGQRVADELGAPLLDIDCHPGPAEGMPIAQIFGRWASRASAPWSAMRSRRPGRVRPA